MRTMLCFLAGIMFACGQASAQNPSQWPEELSEMYTRFRSHLSYVKGYDCSGFATGRDRADCREEKREVGAKIQAFITRIEGAGEACLDGSELACEALTKGIEEDSFDMQSIAHGFVKTHPSGN